MSSRIIVGCQVSTSLRTNLALFHVDYNHFQSPQGTSQQSSAQLALALLTPIYGAEVAARVVPALRTFVIDQGKIRAKGAELDGPWSIVKPRKAKAPAAKAPAKAPAKAGRKAPAQRR